MSQPFETAPVHLAEHQTAKDHEYYRRLNDYYAQSPGTHVDVKSPMVRLAINGLLSHRSAVVARCRAFAIDP